MNNENLSEHLCWWFMMWRSKFKNVSLLKFPWLVSQNAVVYVDHRGREWRAWYECVIVRGSSQSLSDHPFHFHRHRQAVLQAVLQAAWGLEPASDQQLHHHQPSPRLPLTCNLQPSDSHFDMKTTSLLENIRHINLTFVDCQDFWRRGWMCGPNKTSL